jgi:hypothetical protein
MIGRAEGLTDADIAKLESDAPAIHQLIVLMVSEKPQIDRSISLFQQIQPIMAQAWKEFQALEPDMQMVLALLNKPTESDEAHG